MPMSSVTGGRPGMPSSAMMMGSAASLGGGFQSSLSMSMNGGLRGIGPDSGAPGAWPGGSYAGTGGASQLMGQAYGAEGPMGQAYGAEGFAPFGGGMPPALTTENVAMASYGGTYGSSPYTSPCPGLGSTQPSLGMPGLPVTPEYERAAAALGTQIQSLSNPFESAPLSQVNRESSNREVTVQTLQSLSANVAGGVDSLSAPWASQYSMPTAAFNGSSAPMEYSSTSPFDGGVYGSRAVMGEAAPQSDYYGAASSSYGGRGGGAAIEDTVASLQGNPYGRDMPNPGQGFDGNRYGGAGGPPVDVAIAPSEKLKLEAESFNFPTAGSFVATPYDDEGVPAYYDPKSMLGQPGAYDAAPPGGGPAYASQEAMPAAMGSRSMGKGGQYDQGLYDQGSMRPGVASSPPPNIGAVNSYGSYPPAAVGGSAYGQLRDSYESYGGGAGISAGKGAANAYDNPTMGAVNYAAAYGASGGGAYGGDVGAYGGGAYGASAYGDGGMPPCGKVSHASIGNPVMDSAWGGASRSAVGHGLVMDSAVANPLATSGSFVASPFAEGAPTMDMLPPPSMGAYSPPPNPFNGLQTSGSFVASPFADGAPSPDMFGISMGMGMGMGSGGKGGYPASYGSLPPQSYMYGGAQPSTAGAGPSGGSPFGGFGAGPSPFVGFDASVPGKSTGSFGDFGLGPNGAGPSPFVGFDAALPGKSTGSFGDFGLGPQAGSFVAMAPPPPGKEGGGVRFSDKKNDHPGIDAKPRTGKSTATQAAREDANPNSKQSMNRSRDGDKPRVKRKAERRACC